MSEIPKDGSVIKNPADIKRAHEAKTKKGKPK